MRQKGLGRSREAQYRLGSVVGRARKLMELGRGVVGGDSRMESSRAGKTGAGLSVTMRGAATKGVLAAEEMAKQAIYRGPGSQCWAITRSDLGDQSACKGSGVVQRDHRRAIALTWLVVSWASRDRRPASVFGQVAPITSPLLEMNGIDD